MTVYEIMTHQIISRLEEAKKSGKIFHWVKPWTGGAKLPESYLTGKTYSGINLVCLDAGEYITYKGLMEYKASLPEHLAEKVKIKKGAVKYRVYFYGKTDKKDSKGNVIKTVGDDGEEIIEQTWFVRYYQVYNIEDIENIKSNHPANRNFYNSNETLDKLDNAISAYASTNKLTIDIVKDGGNCYYSPDKHMVRIPEKSGFKSQYAYYSAVLHELIHSTSKSLNRDTSNYAHEELVAQIGSCMLLNLYEIVDDKGDEFENDIAYIDSWLKHLNNSGSKEILMASQQAQKACDFFMQESSYLPSV